MTPRPAAVLAGLVLLLAGACGSSAGDVDGDVDAPATTGSAGPTGSTPVQAVTAVMAAMEAGDCADLKAVVVTPDAIDCGSIRALRGAYADEGVDLGDVDLEVDDRTGSSATVTADLGEGADPEVWQTEKVGDAWKVLFDSEE